MTTVAAELGEIMELHFFRQVGRDRILAFHPESYSLFKLGEQLINVIEDLKSGQDFETVVASRGVNPQETQSQIERLRQSIESSWRSKDREFFDPELDYQYKNRKVAVTLHVSNACNLDCDYCYAQGGDYGRQTQTRMDVPLALKAVEVMYENFACVETIMFFGGEPTLAMDVIEAVCSYVDDKCAAGQISERPRYSMITNGTFLDDDDAIRIIKKYQIAITVSVDGPKEINDRLRPYKGGQGSYDNVKAGFDRVVKDAGIVPSIEATFTQAHLEAGMSMADLADFLEKEFDFSLGTIAHVDLPAHHPLAIKDETKVEELTVTFEKMIKAIIAGERPKLERSFLMPLLQFVRKTGTRFTCSVGHDGFDVTTDGDIYPCQVFINQQEFLMGTVHDFNVSNPSPQLQRAVRRLEYRDKYKNPICASCWARHFCFTCPGSTTFSNNNFTVPQGFCKTVGEWMEFVLSVLYEVRTDPSMWSNFLIALKKLSNENERHLPTPPSIIPLATASPERRLYQIQGLP